MAKKHSASDIGDSPLPTAPAGDRGTATPFLTAIGVRELIALGRASQGNERAENILDLVPAGIFACDARGGITFFNRRAADLWRREPQLHDPAERFCGGQKILAADGTPFAPEATPIALAARQASSCRGLVVTFVRTDGSRFDASLDIDPLRDEQGSACGAIVVLQDVTEGIRRERDAKFLGELTEQLANLSSEADLVAVTTRLVGEHFAVDRCAFFEADEVEGKMRVKDGWRRPGMPGVEDVFPTAELIHPQAWQAIAAGPIAVNDTALDPLTRDHLPALDAMGARAFVLCLCAAARPRRFVLGLASSRPREWTRTELALLEQLVARTWPRVERARAEDRLRAQERELNLISENAPAVLSHWDSEHRLIFASRAFAERWNKRPEDLLGQTVAEVLGVTAFERLRPYVDRVLAGESVSFEAELPYLNIGDRYVRASYAPDIDETGRVRGYLAAVLDLTDRRRAEVALFESEERLRLATRTGKVGLWDWDIRGNRVTWTESLYEIHGVRRADFPATIEGFVGLIHPDDRGPVQRAVQSALEHDTRYELEFRAVRPNGVVVWLFTNATVMREEGRAVRMIGATLDVTARKTAELGLRESEARFRTLASHAPVGIFLTDPDGGCLFVNESWRVMAGLSNEQVRGQGWRQALHPDDRDPVFAEWNRAVRERRPFGAEYRFQRPDGTVVWLQGSAVESRNAGGTLTGYLGTVVDITARKAAEDALRESEKRFRTLASHAPVGIFLTDAEGETIFVNEAWSAMVGLAADQATGRNWAKAVHPEDRARVLAEWEDAWREGRPTCVEYRFGGEEGRITWVQGNAVPLRDTAGKVAGYIGTIADVTLRKLAEQKLRAQEAQLRLISTNAPIILAHCDRHERFLFVNRAYAERFQRAPEEIIGRTIREVLGEEARAALAPYIARVLAGEAVEYEIEVPYRDIGVRYMHVSYVPDIAADGAIRGWLSAVSDLTLRRDMERALRESEERYRQLADALEHKVAERTASLQDAIAQMEEFSYSVSHDLRAPLRAMNAYAEALAEDYGPQLDDTARNYLDRIRRNSHRMETLTRDVLTYSRVARTDVELKALSLEPLLRDLITQYAELQPARADIRIHGPLHRVRAHEASLGQALANLLTNAAKFVEMGVRPQIVVRTELTGDRVRVLIQDNGIGIAPRYHASLFQVFERVPTRHPYEGTGIGLAIVRRAMEKMGGRCGVDSDGGNGSCFWIELAKG